MESMWLSCHAIQHLDLTSEILMNVVQPNNLLVEEDSDTL